MLVQRPLRQQAVQVPKREDDVRWELPVWSREVSKHGQLGSVGGKSSQSYWIVFHIVRPVTDSCFTHSNQMIKILPHSFQDGAQATVALKDSTSLQDSSSGSPDNTTFFRPPSCTPTKKVSLCTYLCTPIASASVGENKRQNSLCSCASRCWRKSWTWVTPRQTWSWSGSPVCWRRPRKRRTRWRREPLSASSRRRKNSWLVFRTASSQVALPSARSREARASSWNGTFTCLLSDLPSVCLLSFL